MNSRQRSQEIKVGIVSILAILLFIIGITLGRGWNVTLAMEPIKFRFPNSGGLQEGAPVFVNGVKRGIVTSIKNDNGSVLILANIDNTNDFKKDINSTITILEITGGKKIEISPGSLSEQFNKQNEIPGTNAADIGELFAMLGDIGHDAKNLVRRFDSIAYSANKLLADGKVIEDIKTTVENTAKISNLLSNTLDKHVGDINLTITNLKTISSDLKSMLETDEPKINKLFAKLDSTLDDSRLTISNARYSLHNLDSLINNAKGLINDLEHGNGFLSKLINDPKMTEKLDSTFNSLNDLIKLIKEHGVNVNLRLGTRP